MKSTGYDEVDGIPIRRIKQASVTHLPEYEDGTLYIVSAIVAKAAPHRSDLICIDSDAIFMEIKDKEATFVFGNSFVSYARSPVGTPPGVPTGMDYEPWREHGKF